MKTLQEQWNELNAWIDQLDKNLIDDYWHGKIIPDKAFVITMRAGLHVIAEYTIVEWRINHYLHDKRMNTHKPYCDKRPTKIKVAELRGYIDNYKPDFCDIVYCYMYTDSTGSKVSGFETLCDMKRDRHAFYDGELIDDLAKLKELYDPKEGHIKCSYCGQQRLPADIIYGTIISPNWKRNGFKSPPRPYCKDKPCHGHDQMGHEG